MSVGSILGAVALSAAISARAENVSLPSRPLVFDARVPLGFHVGPVTLQWIRFRRDGTLVKLELETHCAGRDQDVLFGVELLDERGGGLLTMKMPVDLEEGEYETVAWAHAVPEPVLRTAVAFRVVARLRD